MNDNIITHFFCSAFAGFLATVIGSPVDVLKTRMMVEKTGMFECIKNTIKNEVFKILFLKIIIFFLILKNECVNYY